MLQKMKTIVLLTGSELRHDFFRKFIACDSEINVLASFCESKKGNLSEIVKKEESKNEFRTNHLSARELTEDDFFGIFSHTVQDLSNPQFLEKGEINNPEYVQQIIELNPDIIISYGCSIIRSELLTIFKKRFVNIHLGLSPYYRGSGTNFWPFVNNELQFIGTTFMHIDHGIDTGEIIHQLRANINSNDTIHQIGNRLIKDSFVECIGLIKNFDALDDMEPIAFDKTTERYYRKKDFTEESLKIAYHNLDLGSLDKYLNEKEGIDAKYPILKNPKI